MSLTFGSSAATPLIRALISMFLGMRVRRMSFGPEYSAMCHNARALSQQTAHEAAQRLARPRESLRFQRVAAARFDRPRPANRAQWLQANLSGRHQIGRASCRERVQIAVGQESCLRTRDSSA